MSLYYNGYYNASYPSLHPLAHPAVAADFAHPCAAPAPLHPYHLSRSVDFGVDAATIAEIENRVQAVAATQRAPIVKKETIPVPGPLGRIRNVIRRLPTPAPDVIERTFVIKPHKDQVNVLIEKPIPPPTQVVHRQVVEDPGLPVVNHQVVRVHPRHLPPAVAVAPAVLAPSPIPVRVPTPPPVDIVVPPPAPEVTPVVEPVVQIEATNQTVEATPVAEPAPAPAPASIIQTSAPISLNSSLSFGSYYGYGGYGRYGGYYPHSWYPYGAYGSFY